MSSIEKITWEEIHEIWATKLWPNRTTPIETHSAMNYLTGFDLENMKSTPTFFGCFVKGRLIGTNSGHGCINNMYRSRGLWVDPVYRGNGLGQQLLLATIKQAKIEGYDMIWSLPRKTSWPTYKGAGFILGSDWHQTETSEQNAYCYIKLG